MALCQFSQNNRVLKFKKDPPLKKKIWVERRQEFLCMVVLYGSMDRF
jgi:hypothetical protein